MLGQHGGQGFAPAGRFGEQQHAAFEAGEVVFQLAEWVFGAAVDSNVGQGGRRRVALGLQSQSSVAFGGGEEGFVGEEEFVRWQQWACLVALQQIVA